MVTDEQRHQYDREARQAMRDPVAAAEWMEQQLLALFSAGHERWCTGQRLRPQARIAVRAQFAIEEEERRRYDWLCRISERDHAMRRHALTTLAEAAGEEGR